MASSQMLEEKRPEGEPACVGNEPGKGTGSPRGGDPAGVGKEQGKGNGAPRGGGTVSDIFFVDEGHQY